MQLEKALKLDENFTGRPVLCFEDKIGNCLQEKTVVGAGSGFVKVSMPIPQELGEYTLHLYANDAQEEIITSAKVQVR